MKYKEMVKFLNDNGVYVMQPVVASEINALLKHSVSDEEFEEICESVYENYLSNADVDVTIDVLAYEELYRRELV